MKPLKMKRSNTWSPLSNVTVHLKASRDYQKLLVVMYGVVIIALFQSNVYWMVDVMLIGAFGVYFIFLWRMQTPGAPCVQIQHMEQQWRVYSRADQFDVYQVACIRFDFGWLMWLIFQNQSERGKVTRKHVLLFQDQITSDENRLIRVLLRVYV